MASSTTAWPRSCPVRLSPATVGRPIKSPVLVSLMAVAGGARGAQLHPALRSPERITRPFRDSCTGRARGSVEEAGQFRALQVEGQLTCAPSLEVGEVRV